MEGTFMTLKDLQMRLDFDKWTESEKVGEDLCGKLNYCELCEGEEEYPCAKAYNRLFEKSKKTTTAKKAEKNETPKAEVKKTARKAVVKKNTTKTAALSKKAEAVLSLNEKK